MHNQCTNNQPSEFRNREAIARQRWIVKVILEHFHSTCDVGKLVRCGFL